jgi:transcriptional regulator with XRE-family HTH domain
MPRHAKLTRIARTFGAQLRRRRDELGLTQEELAHRAGIDVSFLSRCERGLSQPSIGLLIQIGRALQTRSPVLMGELEDALSGK